MAEQTGGSRDSTGLTGPAIFAAVATGAFSGFLGDFLTKILLENAHPGLGAVAGLVFAVFATAVTAHYWAILGYGGFEKGSPQNKRYGQLRSALRGGGQVGSVYARMLRSALDRVDGFFGDRGEFGTPRLASWFGIKEPCPLWSAHSYERCLLIAIIYPIAVIFLVWAASGHVGPAEAALRLQWDVPGWRRATAILILGLLAFAAAKYEAAVGWQRETIWGGVVIALTFALMFTAGFGPGGVAAVVAMVIGGWFAAGPLLSGIAVWVMVTLVVNETLGSAIAGAVIGIAAGVPTVVFVERAFGWGERRGRLGVILSIWTAMLLALAIVVPWLIAHHPLWPGSGPILLFCILFTLVNAPFDWLTVGLTRALLRRGLELGGWWPLAYGLIDLFAATAVAAALGVVMLWAMQAFGHFAQLGGGSVIVDPSKLLAAIDDPALRAAPQYWWLYATMLSTLVPSILNVALGALSLMRGVPGVHERLARRLPASGVVLDSERIWLAPLLALQATVSLLVGIAVMFGLVWIILVWALPLIGLNLVPLLQSLAALDVPGRLLGLLQGAIA